MDVKKQDPAEIIKKVNPVSRDQIIETQIESVIGQLTEKSFEICFFYDPDLNEESE